MIRGTQSARKVAGVHCRFGSFQIQQKSQPHLKKQLFFETIRAAMPKRRLTLFALLILCGLAAWGAYMYWTPLQGQFGGQHYSTYPDAVLQQACQSPITPGTNNRTPPSYKYEGCKGSTGWCFGKSRNNDFQCTYGECEFDYNLSAVPECGWMPPYNNVEPVPPGGFCEASDCCRNGTYEDDTVELDCAQGATCLLLSNGGFYGGSGRRCCTNADATSIYNCNTSSVSSAPPASSNSSASGPRCGDGTTQANGADGQAGTSDDEECDGGDLNIPTGSGSVSEKEWENIEDDDEVILTRSNCLDTCKKAQCSDGRDNDGKNGTDANDRACNGGPYGDGPHLRGYNKEACPTCTHEDPADALRPANMTAQLITANASLFQNGVPAPNGGNVVQVSDRVKNYYCTDGKDINGQSTGCSCQSNTQVQYMDGSCHAITADSMWGSACLIDSDCRGNPGAPRRCAYYSKVTENGYDIQLWRCKQLVDEGERGCRSRWDCIDNYRSTTTYNTEGWFPWKDPTPFRCLSGAGNAVGKCCGPDTQECKRPGYVNQQGPTQLPPFENCGKALPCPQGMEMFCVGFNAGGDGGGNSGDDGGNTSGTAGGSAGSSASSSANTCNNTNPCLAITQAPTGSCHWGLG